MNDPWKNDHTIAQRDKIQRNIKLQHFEVNSVMNIYEVCGDVF